MVQIFYSRSNDIVSNLIRLFTWSEYSHVGFVLPGGNLILDTMFSTGGVEIRSMAELKAQATDVFIITYPHLSEKALDIARTQVGKPYDWTAICGIPFRRNWQEDDSWFCSELVAWSCEQAGTPMVNQKAWRVTPQDLLEAAVKS